MDTVLELAAVTGVRAACDALGVARSSLYRLRPIMGPVELAMSRPAVKKTKAPPARSLSAAERAEVLAIVHSERFQDQSPAAIHATLLDEGVYHCSIRTICRLLKQSGESRERRDHLTHPAYVKPELLATEPNQLWSWDITKMMGPAKWTYFHLYVILDIFSRYIVGWMVAPRESAELARRLIADTCAKQNISEKQLTLHADRGSSMTSKPVRSCWPTSASPKHTAVRMCPTTTLIQKANSGR